MALFVVQNSRPLKFYLLGLKKSEYDKYKKLITDNGGEVSPTGDYPVINFSMPGCFQNNKLVFHVCYIEECIKQNRILNLVDFNISKKNGYEGCPLSSLIFGNPRCKLAFVSVPSVLSDNNEESQYNKTTKDTKTQKYNVKNSVDKPLGKSIILVEYTDDDDDDDDENGDDNDDDDKSNKNKDSSDKEKTIEKSSVNEQSSLYQSANSSTEMHNSNVINHTNKRSIPNSAEGGKCGIKQIVHETKLPNTPQSNKKSNSSYDYISSQAPQSKLIDHVDLISDDEMEIVPENSVPQSLGLTMVDVITDDEDEDKLFIDDDESFVPVAYKSISKKENDSSVMNKSHTDCNTSNDSVISNTTDDLSDSPVNTRKHLSSRKFSNLRYIKD